MAARKSIEVRQPKRTAAIDKHTAIHEAGHSVLYDRLGLGCRSATINRNEAEGEEGHTEHGGEEQNDGIAEEAFLLRHAIGCYAGEEAMRRAGVRNPRVGAESDDYDAVSAVNRITDDAKSIDLLYPLARRRCAILVKHYWPEIKAVAAALLSKRTLTGEEIHEMVTASARKRRAGALCW